MKILSFMYVLMRMYGFLATAIRYDRGEDLQQAAFPGARW